MIEGRAAGIGPCQQAAYAAKCSQSAVQIEAARVSDLNAIRAVALLNREQAVIDEVGFIRLNPNASAPAVIFLDPPPADAIKDKLRFPGAGKRDIRQLILGIEGEGAETIVR